VSKATTASLLALTLVAVLPGCGKEAPPAAPAPATEAAAAPHPMPAAAPATDIDLTGIAKADGGKTIAEVYAEKDQLGDATIIVRGKVVKTNAEIMGKNWLHVRDGSGAEGSNDLTVTTAGELPKVGDTVLVSGKVSLNKDFGMGYQYPVIMEDAEVTVE